MSRAFLIVAAFSSIALRAQPSTLFGPVQGYTYDAPTKTIRAVIGSLGSASLGPAILRQVEFASVAPRQDYAVLFRRGETVLVTGLSSGTLSETVFPESSFAAEGVAWSGDGSAAVLYSQTAGWIQTFTGLPTSVNAGPPISIAALGGSLNAVAADPHGQNVAIGVTGDQGGVYRISAGQSFSPLVMLVQPISLAFSEDGSALYALDGATNQVSEVDLASSASQTWPAGVDDAIAIRPSHDSSNRSVLYVAGRNSRLLTAFDGSTHQSIASVALSFVPAIIDPLGNNGFLLRLRTTDSEPLWSFTNSVQPSVYFVPATPILADHRPEGRPK